jgi:hypothetical protein
VQVVGRALQGGYREKVRLAATLPVSQATSLRELECSLAEQLQWLGTERIDFCLLGRLTRDNLPKLNELGVLRWAERAMADGRIGKLGFSFHDHFQILRNLLNTYDQWSVCEVQYSYMDVDHDPGISGIKYAAEKGLAVVATEPLRSGRLTRRLPAAVAKLWTGVAPRSPAEWGLRFVWNHAEVATVVCGMSSKEQVAENTAVAAKAEPDSLTIQELVVFAQVQDAYRSLRQVNCPSCRACMPCPLGIDVPRIFELYNDTFVYNDASIGRVLYQDEGHTADVCTECGVCAAACAKRLPILKWLGLARELLE